MLKQFTEDQNLAIVTIAAMGFTVAVMEDRVLVCAEFVESDGRQLYHNIVGRDITKMLDEQHVLSAVSSYKTLITQASYGNTVDSMKKNPHSDTIVTAMDDIKQMRYKYHRDCIYKLVMSR